MTDDGPRKRVRMQLKQDHMDSRERLTALLTGRPVDRVPIGSLSDGFNAINAGLAVADAYDDPQKSFDAHRWTCEQYGWDPIPDHPMAHTVLGAMDFGGRVRLPRGDYEAALVVESFPAFNEALVGALEVPDAHRAGRIPKMLQLARLQAEDRRPVFFFSRSPFSMAANICGTDRFMRWLIKKPELCQHLMAMALEHIFNVLEIWVGTFGAERIFAWMSSPGESNQLISTRMLARFAVPAHLRYHERLRQLGIKRFGFHICGEQNANLPLLAEAMLWPHPSVLSFGHEVTLADAARFFPDDILYGNIDPAIIQTASPRRVYALSREAIEAGKHAAAGFILGPGCGLPVKAPPVNVWAMTRAVKDHGWY